jgi:sugar phosphate isomerase/epimerase
LAETAAKLDAKRAFVALPPGSDRLPIHEYFEKVRSRLEQMGAILAGKDIKLGVALNASKEGAEGKTYETIRNVEGFLALIKSVSAANVGFVIDSWHWLVGGGTLEQLRAIDPNRVVVVRLADLPAEVSPADAKTSDRVIPSQEGRFDQVALVKWLSESGYKGPVLPCSSAAKAKGQTRESIVNKAQEAIDGIFRAAGLTVDPRPMDLIQTLYADLGRDEEDDRPMRPMRSGLMDDDVDDLDDDSLVGGDDLELPSRSR